MRVSVLTICTLCGCQSSLFALCAGVAGVSPHYLHFVEGQAWISNTFDNNGRMLGTWLTNSASNIDSSVYTYNVGNQRTQVTRTGENIAA